MRTLLLVVGVVSTISSVASAQKPDSKWLTQFKSDALKAGISASTVALMDSVELVPKVIELDRKQPESTMTFEDYRGRVIKPERLAEGRRLWALHRDDIVRAADKYGVDPQFIVALWGVETHFGTRMGEFSIIPSLTTLALDGRRPKFFRAQLIEALRIIDRKDISLDDMKGSWAGAMGHCQFMPSTFATYAVDMDGDGRRDLWRSLPDVFGSAAHYLSKVGWKRSRGWGELVTLPEGFDESLLGRETKKTRAEWRKLGVLTSTGEALGGGSSPVSLIRPGKNSSKVFLVEGNFHVLLRWNNSEYFATVVSLLATEMALESGETPSATKGSAL